ncbi:hypothetical protein QL285_087052 [Trifolium repens]|nr:hypothetical protein QL285_087052 [Trifolium repens]
MSTSVAPMNQGASSSGVRESFVMPQNYQHYDPFNEMNDMITNALGFNVPNYVPNDVDDPDDDEYDADVNIEQPHDEAQRFFDLLKETNKPLFEDNHDDLPKNYYEAKQLVAKLGLEVKRIDCCVNGCMLYYNNEFGVSDGALLECKFCQEPRYRVTRNSRASRRKPIPRKAMFYLPIIPRLQRWYTSVQTASKMTWHRENYERRKMSVEPFDRLCVQEEEAEEVPSEGDIDEDDDPK